MNHSCVCACMCVCVRVVIRTQYEYIGDKVRTMDERKVLSRDNNWFTVYTRKRNFISISATEVETHSWSLFSMLSDSRCNRENLDEISKDDVTAPCEAPCFFYRSSFHRSLHPMKRLTSEFRLRFSLHPSLPRGMHIIIVIFIIATTIVFTTLEIRPKHLWSKLASINSTNLRRPFASYIHDFPANLCLTKNPLPRIRHELGFDDIIRGVNSAVGRSVEIGNIGADRPGKNTAPIFCREPSQLFRHNERVYGRNYAKLYAATRSNVGDNAGGRGDPIFAEYTRSRRGGIYRRADTENGSGRRDVRSRFELIIPSRGSRWKWKRLSR